MTQEEVTKRLANSAGVMKLICGVANNASWLSMLDGYDHARMCKGYRNETKRLFKRAVESFHEYERRLIYATDNRMFHVDDMTPAVRKMYGDISDRQYYEFWSATGSVAYQKTRPLLTSLWNKYRKSLEREGVKEPEHIAWVMVATATLDLAIALYEKAIKECMDGYKLPKVLLERIFGQFSLSGTADLWRKALVSLCPGTEHIGPNSLDKRNIELGLTQLCDAWMDPTLLYRSTIETVEEYDEVFRTKGEQKKALRETKERMNETEYELERQ